MYDIEYLSLFMGIILIVIGICLCLCLLVSVISYIHGYNNAKASNASNSVKYSRIVDQIVADA